MRRKSLDVNALIVDSGEPIATGDGMALTIKQVPSENNNEKAMTQGTRISTPFYVSYGTVTAKMRMSPGSGIITSFILMADEKDEIDYEWLGIREDQVQTNYFYGGILDYTRGGIHTLPTNLAAEYHVYTIDWTPDKITWYVDGNIVRTLDRWNATGTGSDGRVESRYPYRPARVQIGIWDTSNMPKGVQEWAGIVDWSNNREYQAHIQWLNISCSTGMDEPVSSAISSFISIRHLLLPILMTKLVLWDGFTAAWP